MKPQKAPAARGFARVPAPFKHIPTIKTSKTHGGCPDSMTMEKCGRAARAGILNALVGIAILTGGEVFAHERPTPAQIEEARQRGDLEDRLAFMKSLGTDRMSEEMIEQAQTKIERARLEAAGYDAATIDSLAPLLAWRGLPPTGAPKVLAIMVDFNDHRAPAAPSPGDVQTNLFGTGTAAAQAFFPFESLNRYYLRASEGLLNLQGNVLGPHHFLNNRAFYQPATSDPAARNQAIFNMVKEALDSLDASGHDFGQYDNDGDGYIDAVIVLYQGPPGAWATFWWAYHWSFFVNDASLNMWDGRKLKKFVFSSIPGRGVGSTDYDPRGMCHQVGHLFGLPDYFDYSPARLPKGGVGGLDMMDGSKGNHNAFSRWVLDWISPAIVGSGVPLPRTLNAGGDPALAGNKAILVFPGAAMHPFGQFFMIENRFRVANGNDGGQSLMPGDGLLIWHLDTTLAPGGLDFLHDNSDGARKFLRLAQADGLGQIEAGGNADAADYFNSTKAFTPASKPGSNSYEGSVTNVSVSNISANNRVMTAQVGFANPIAQVVATPLIDPPGGLLTGPAPVTLACDTPSATIHYTLDGSSPSQASPVYSTPIDITTAATLKARAFVSGMTDSAIATASFSFKGVTILADGVAKTALSGAQGAASYFVINVPAGETKLEIKTSGGTGDADMYVRFGAFPDLATYDHRPFIPGNAETVTISNPAAGPWYVMLNGYAAYGGVALLADHSRLLAKVATPVFSPVPGTYSGGVDVVMSCATTGATIRYTTDRTDPTASSPAYTGPVSLLASGQLRARAFYPTYADSDMKVGNYNVTGVSTVGKLTDGVALAGQSGAAGAVKYYRLEVPASQTHLMFKISGGTGDCDLYVRYGALPTAATYDYRPYQSGNNEGVAITDPAAGTWYVMLRGYSTYSGVTLLGDHVRLLGTVATPLFTPAPGAYAGSVNVAITCATPGAVIRYTTDGSTPTRSSLVHGASMTLTATKTIKARAFLADYADSAVASGAFTVSAAGPDVVVLSDGAAKSVSGAAGSEQFFVIRVPAGQNKLRITTTGGTGDCDLHVRRRSKPSTTTWDFRPYSSGNVETVEIINPEAGDFYIMLRGNQSFAGVSLLADYSTTQQTLAAPVFSPSGGTFSAAPVAVSINSSTPDAVIYYTTNGSAPTATSLTYTGSLVFSATTVLKAIATKPGYANSAVTTATYTITVPAGVTTLVDGANNAIPAGALSSERFYKITVPAGMARLDIKISGGTGDCDLYVRHGAAPTRTAYDYRPYLVGNSELVSVSNPAAGDWYVMLRGQAAYSGVVLVADYVPALSVVANPVFNPAPGAFTTQVNVTLKCATAGATIRYTTDGSDPTPASNLYAGAINLTSTTTVKAQAFKAGSSDSAIVAATYTINPPPVTALLDGVARTGLAGAAGSLSFYQVAVPQGQAKLDISIAGGSGDCDLFMRWGALPTQSVYDFRPYLGGNGESVTVSNPVDGVWYVMLRGYGSFAGVTLLADYAAALPTVALPTITPAAGTFNPPVSVTMACATAGATIRYTTDGSAPTSSSPAYTGAFALNTPGVNTVKAVAFKPGYNDSPVATASLTINAPPVTQLTDRIAKAGLAGAVGSEAFFKISVPPNQAKLEIRISGGTGDCDLYVRQGQQPTTSLFDFRPAVGGNIETVLIDQPSSGDWYVMLRGFNSFSGVSLVADHAMGTVATPTFSPAPGSYATADPVLVTLATTTGNADIRYTTDGSTPTGSSTLYSGPISVTSTTTIKAKAFKSNYLDSAVATGIYTIPPPPVTVLADGVAVGGISAALNGKRYYRIDVPAGQEGRLEISTSGVTGDCDLYVRQGSFPTEAQWDFRPFAGGSNETVNVTSATTPVLAAGQWFIMLDGYSAFSGLSLKADYSANMGTVVNPVISPGSSTSPTPITVNLACATVGVTIRYTTDGSMPTGASPAYTGPFTIGATATVKAIGQLAGYSESGAVSATYTVNGPAVTPLIIGAPIANLSGALASKRYFKLTVPSAITGDLTFSTSGGTGDGDLHVRTGALPTLSAFDQRSTRGGNVEFVTLTDPPAGDHYIMLSGYAAYAGVTLNAVTAPPVATTPLSLPAKQTNQSGAQGSEVFYKIVVPAGASEMDVSIAGGTGNCDLYLRRGFVPTTAFHDYRPFLAGNAEGISVPNPEAGDWYVMLRGADAYAGVTLSANAFSFTSLGNPSELPGLNGAALSMTYYKITVLPGQNDLSISTAGGTGDCDLYLKKGSPPTTTSYDSRRQNAGNGEIISMSNPASGDYYIGVYGFGSYSGVTLRASAIKVTGISNHAVLPNLSGGTNGVAYYKISIPAGRTFLDVLISNGNGDCDLYVRHAAPPTLSTYDFAPNLNGNSESITATSPAAGTWYIMLRGNEAYSGVSLSAGTN